MRHLLPAFALLLPLAPTLEASARSADVHDRAFAADLTGEGRDAFLMMAAGGEGIVVFEPLADGRFSRQLLLGMGQDVEWFAVDDVDSDGRADLIVARSSGDLALWRGDGRGRFLEPDWTPKASHAGHAQHGADGPPAGARDANLRSGQAGQVAAIDRPGQREAILGREMEHLRANAARALREQKAQADARGRSGAIAEIMAREGGVAWTAGDLGGDMGQDIAVATAHRTVLIYRDDGGGDLGTPEVVPIGFVPSVIAAGRFTGSGRQDLAVAGPGPRPSFVVLQSLETASHDGGRSSIRGRFAVRDVVAPFTTVTVNVGQGGLNFNPSSVSILTGDTVRWVWATSVHSVTSGTSCTANNTFCSPNNVNCSAGATSNSGAVYQRVFPVAGSFPYFCAPHCLAGMTGVVNVLAAPGTVPDGATVPGTELKVTKLLGGNIQITWGASCSASANNHAVYEGTLPIAGVYNHTSRNCSLGNVLSASLAPSAGNRYYLIVPETAANEGSYGRATGGAERPQGGGACKPQLLGCP